MRVELDDSIPAEVKKRVRWMLVRAADEPRDYHEIALTPPLPSVISFTSPLATLDGDVVLRVNFRKHKTANGWLFSMNQHDARLAREFIEKHYG